MELELNGNKFQADVRKATELKPVLAFPEDLKVDFDAYYMFRDVYHKKDDHKLISKAGLRYDYTVIPPNKVGKEYIKTYGHYHPLVTEKLSYPEVYQVQSGKAIYLLQKADGDKVNEVLAIFAEGGDVVIIPPNFGHVTINPSNEYLVMTNWVCRDFKSIYDPYTKMRGACYYYTEDGWIKNKNYSLVPELKFAKAIDVLDTGGEDMYWLILDIEKLRFLKEPQNYRDIFNEALKIIEK